MNTFDVNKLQDQVERLRRELKQRSFQHERAENEISTMRVNSEKLQKARNELKSENHQLTRKHTELQTLYDKVSRELKAKKEYNNLLLGQIGSKKSHTVVSVDHTRAKGASKENKSDNDVSAKDPVNSSHVREIQDLKAEVKKLNEEKTALEKKANSNDSVNVKSGGSTRIPTHHQDAELMCLNQSYNQERAKREEIESKLTQVTRRMEQEQQRAKKLETEKADIAKRERELEGNVNRYAQKVLEGEEREKKLGKRIQSMEGSEYRITRESDTLRTAVSAKDEEIAALRRKLTATMDGKREKDGGVKNLKNRIQTLESGFESAKTKEATTKRELEKKINEIGHLTEENSSLQRQKGSLERSLKMLENERGSLKRELQDALKKARVARAELSTPRTSQNPSTPEKTQTPQQQYTTPSRGSRTASSEFLSLQVFADKQKDTIVKQQTKIEELMLEAKAAESKYEDEQSAAKEQREIVKTLREKIDQNVEELKAKSEEIVRLRSEIKKGEDQIHTTKGKLDDISSAVARLEELKEENKQLKAVLEEKTKSNAVDAEKARKVKERGAASDSLLAEREEELILLRKRVTEGDKVIRAADKQNSDVRAKVSVLKEKVDEQARKLEETKNIESELEVKLEEVKKQKTIADAQLAKFVVDHKAIMKKGSDRVHELMARERELIGRIELMDNSLDKSEKQVESLKASLRALEEENSTLIKKLDEVEGGAEDAVRGANQKLQKQQENEELATMNGNLLHKEQAAQHSNLKEMYNRLSTERDMLQTEKSRLLASHEELARRLEELEENEVDLKKQHQNLEVQAENLTENYRRSVDEGKALRSEHEMLKGELTRATADLADLTHQRDSFGKQVKSLGLSRERLEENLSSTERIAAEREKEISALTSKVREVEFARAELESQFAAQSIEMERKEGLYAQTAEEAERLRTKLDADIEREAAETRRLAFENHPMFTQMREEFEKLTQRMEVAEEHRSAAVEKVTSLKAAIEDSEEANSSMRKLMGEQAAQIAELQSSISKKEANLLNFAERSEASDSENERLKAALKELQQEVLVMEKELARVQGELYALRGVEEEKQSKASRISELNAEIVDQRGQLRELGQENDQLQAELNASEEREYSLQDVVDNAQKALNDAESALGEAKGEMSELKEERRLLEEEMEAMKETMESTRSRSSSERFEMHQREEELALQVSHLEERLLASSEREEELRRQLNDFSMDVASYKRKEEGSKGDIISLQLRLDEAQGEKERLHSEVNEYRKIMEVQEMRLADSEENVRRLERKVSFGESELEEITQNLVETEKVLSDRKAELISVRESLKTAETSLQNEDMKVSQLEMAVSAADTEKEEMQKQLSDLDVALQKQRELNVSLRNTLASSRTDMENASYGAASASREKQEIKMELEDANEIAKRLREELEETRQAVEEERSRSENLKTENALLTAQMDSLSSAVGTEKEHQESILEKKESQNEKLRHELNSALEEVDSTSNELRELRMEVANERVAQMAHEEEQRLAMEELRAENTSQSAISQTRISKLEGETERLAASLKSADIEIEGLRRRLESVQGVKEENDSILDELKRELAQKDQLCELAVSGEEDARKENIVLEDELEQLERAKEELELEKERLEELNAEGERKIINLKEAKEDARIRAAEANEAARKKVSQVESLEIEVRVLKADLEEKSREAVAATNDLVKERSLTIELKTAKNEAESKYDDSTRKAEMLDEKLADLESQLAELQREKESISDQLTEKTTALSEMLRESSLLRNKIALESKEKDAFEAGEKEKDHEVMKLRDEVNEKETVIFDLKRENEKLRFGAKEVESIEKDMAARIDGRNANIEALKEEISKLHEARVKSEEERIESEEFMRAELKRAREDAEVAVRECEARNAVQQQQQDSLEERNAALDKVEEAKESLKAELEEKDKAIDQLRKENDSQRHEISENRINVAEMNFSLEAARAEAHIAKKSREEKIAIMSDELKNKAASLSAVERSKAREEARLKEELNVAIEELEEERTRSNHLQESVSEIRARLGELSHDLSLQQKAVIKKDIMLEECEEEIDNLNQEISDLKDKMADLSSQRDNQNESSQLAEIKTLANQISVEEKRRLEAEEALSTAGTQHSDEIRALKTELEGEKMRLANESAALRSRQNRKVDELHKQVNNLVEENMLMNAASEEATSYHEQLVASANDRAAELSKELIHHKEELRKRETLLQGHREELEERKNEVEALKERLESNHAVDSQVDYLKEAERLRSLLQEKETEITKMKGMLREFGESGSSEVTHGEEALKFKRIVERLQKENSSLTQRCATLIIDNKRVSTRCDKLQLKLQASFMDRVGERKVRRL